MGRRCVAVDIGASSGRIITGELDKGQLVIRECHRFKNGVVKQGDKRLWDLEGLFSEILKGLSKIEDYESIGIDTWGVDYVLLNSKGEVVEPTYSYRDSRTRGLVQDFKEIMDPKIIYRKTGIQFLEFNTLYQLYAYTLQGESKLTEGCMLLFIPDYLNYLLTGITATEYTVATTSQLINQENRHWDADILKTLGCGTELFPYIVYPGTKLGNIKSEFCNHKNGQQPSVYTVASHDTASAVVAVPAVDDDWAYISSGTWSLMGMEIDEPLCSDKALLYNFTNEGGAKGIRLLKNIMGLWLIQRVKEELEEELSFEELVKMAEYSDKNISLIHPDDHMFLNPECMIEAIQSFCKESGQYIPETPGELARCIFESLAMQYKQVMLQLKELTGKDIKKIHIVGGGCKNNFLNQLCADYTGCTVIAGPDEATAMGNIIVQLKALGEIESIEEGRTLIKESVDIRTFSPRESTDFHKLWQKFIEL